jgi:hypothetical protein
MLTMALCGLTVVVLSVSQNVAGVVQWREQRLVQQFDP